MDTNIEPLDGEDEISPERAAQIRQLQTWLKEHPYGEQDENGVDISLLRENLKLTPAERLIKHQKALERIGDLRRASTRHYYSRNNSSLT
jgi:hypothetical protein